MKFSRTQRSRTQTRVFGAALVALLAAAGAFARFAQFDELPPPAESVADCDRAASADVRFASYDVFVDAGAVPLAAWQVEVVDEAHVAQLAGVEGGEHPAFAEPPFYDPRAMLTERVVLAAFSTDSALPEGRVRVARLHYQIQSGQIQGGQIEGAHEPRFTVTLVAAATSDGRAIEARASLGN